MRLLVCFSLRIFVATVTKVIVYITAITDVFQVAAVARGATCTAHGTQKAPHRK